MRSSESRLIQRVVQGHPQRLEFWIDVEPMVENWTRPFKASKTAQIRVVYNLMSNEWEIWKTQRFWLFLQIIEACRQPWLTVYRANYSFISAEALYLSPSIEKTPSKIILQVRSYSRSEKPVRSTSEASRIWKIQTAPQVRHTRVYACICACVGARHAKRFRISRARTRGKQVKILGCRDLSTLFLSHDLMEAIFFVNRISLNIRLKPMI